MYQLIKVTNYITHCICIIDVAVEFDQVHSVWHAHSQPMLLSSSLFAHVFKYVYADSCMYLCDQA